MKKFFHVQMPPNSFNSCMVQLKLRTIRSCATSRRVLIPVWCNWNVLFVSSVCRAISVLIPVWCNWNPPAFGRRRGYLPRFNSCMVQLKSISTTCTSTVQYVLIPVWCNWNVGDSLWYAASPFVLIPVWCNWNLFFSTFCLFLIICFNSCMVQLKYGFTAVFVLTS